MKTVTIAGGGLAGLSLGIALRRKGVPVRIKEAGNYPRHRVCGEFITGVDAGVLEDLGIIESLDDALNLRTVTWFSESESVSTMVLPRKTWGLSRWSLDHALAEQFRQLGGDLVTNSREDRRAGDCDGLVWAAGRHPASKKGTRRWIGLKVHLSGIELAGDLELHLGGHGYAGISRIENQQLNLCGLFRQKAEMGAKGIDLLKAYLRANALHRLADYLQSGKVDDSSFTAVSALEYGLFSRPQAGFVLGDNWSLIPPFTGNGMSMAFESAHLAAKPLSAWSKGELDWTETVQQYRAAMRQSLWGRVRRARLFHGFLLVPATRHLLVWLARRDALPFLGIYSLTH